jgi:NNP family nitrate/nitrite transporter-like MFS transporter
VVWVSLMWMYWTEVRPMDAARQLKRLQAADQME